MNIEKQCAFIESLEGEKGLREKFYRLLDPAVDTWLEGDEFLDTTDDNNLKWIETKIPSTVKNPFRICRRLESRQIPDLQKQQPKRYTEEELRRAYESEFSDETGEDNTWHGWKMAASFLGMIKTEGES